MQFCGDAWAYPHSTSVFGDRRSFRGKGLRFVPSRWHHLNREIERRREQEGERAKGQESKKAKENVKM